MTGLTLISGGSGYYSAPAITFSGYNGSGSGATASAALAPRPVASFMLTNRGSRKTAFRFDGVLQIIGA